MALTTLAGLHAGLWLSLYLTRNMSDEDTDDRQGHAVPTSRRPRSGCGTTRAAGARGASPFNLRSMARDPA